MATQQRFRISGMTCPHCIQAVQDALQTLPGLEQLSVTLAPAQAIVTGNVLPEAVVAAIAQEGYKAVLEATVSTV
jgi:copper chaperone